MRPTRTDQQPNVQIELADGIPATAENYARAKIPGLVKYSRLPILFIKVRLMPAGHGHNVDVVAHANMDVNGTPLISHSVGKTATEAVDLLQDKLRGQLSRM
ncbi:ribosome-associated translation inhibitor RaiA [Kibdelosporangium banguiense]|uniref:Ribosome-associated translation inhibitor RaiA n=1 Tax=Kibdelosporangium banguiense TaxID=1365924 RepID=A0ABS4TWJ1_9PSEU|nr:HPF/RaiA family ribosome-associated protein [Kibdelosporangium banguiense]MBP2328786.1 ribosome-associated translation inhibitor RaiA [Kibdelosporangium banguiense]